MSRTGKTMDRVRRCVDNAMIFASLLLLTWPPLAQDGGATGFATAVAVVAGVGAGVVLLTRRWPLLRFLPVAVAVLMAGFWFGRHGAVSEGLTWLTVAV